MPYYTVFTNVNPADSCLRKSGCGIFLCVLTEAIGVSSSLLAGGGLPIVWLFESWLNFIFWWVISRFDIWYLPFESLFFQNLIFVGKSSWFSVFTSESLKNFPLSRSSAIPICRLSRGASIRRRGFGMQTLASDWTAVVHDFLGWFGVPPWKPSYVYMYIYIYDSICMYNYVYTSIVNIFIW